MANSSIIGKVKRKIMREFIKDENIVAAINGKIDDPEDLLDKYIFDYNQNPYTIQDVQTFITVQVHIPEARFSYSYTQQQNNTFVSPTVEIWITSHENHMRVKNIPKVTQNRNDYLSALIDTKLNGSTDYGIGKLFLTSNKEFSYEKDYLSRVMIFTTLDLNNSMCIDEDEK